MPSCLVQYPRKKTLFQMAMSPEYQAIHRHREAGLEGQINYAVLQTSPVIGERDGVSATEETRPGVSAHARLRGSPICRLSTLRRIIRTCTVTGCIISTRGLSMRNRFYCSTASPPGVISIAK